MVVSFASDYASWSHNKSSRWLETVIHLWMSIFFSLTCGTFWLFKKEVFVMMMKWKLLSIIFVNWTLSTQFGYLSLFFLLESLERWRSSFKCCWPHLLNYIVMCSTECRDSFSNFYTIQNHIFIFFLVVSLSLTLSFVWCDIKAKSRFLFWKFFNWDSLSNCVMLMTMTKWIFFIQNNAVWISKKC